MFWDVAAVFQRLRDAHVTLGFSPLGALQTTMIGGVNDLFLVLKRFFDSGEISEFKTIFKIENEIVSLTIDEYDSTTNELLTSKVVKTIDGQSPGQFVTKARFVPHQPARLRLGAVHLR